MDENPKTLAILGLVALLGVFVPVFPVYDAAWVVGIGLLVWAAVAWRRGKDRRDRRDAVRRALRDAARDDAFTRRYRTGR